MLWWHIMDHGPISTAFWWILGLPWWWLHSSSSSCCLFLHRLWPPRQFDSPHEMPAATPVPMHATCCCKYAALVANLALFLPLFLPPLLIPPEHHPRPPCYYSDNVRDRWVGQWHHSPKYKKPFCTHLKNVYLFMYANVLSNGCNFRESFSKVILFYL